MSNITPAESASRDVLVRGIYEEARRRQAPHIAYALFHDLGVTREEVHSHLGYAISDYYQIYVTDKRRAAATPKVEGA